MYALLTSSKEDIIVIKPTFTLSAYQKGGFYDYYKKACDERCLTVSLIDNETAVDATAFSYHTLTLLQDVGYKTITDQEIDQNPSILSTLKQVIVLHSEYVSQKEYEAITHHPNVVYVKPNALYALVQPDYANNTISLIRGHTYQGVNNAFNWKYDNTEVEKAPCWFSADFRVIDNGRQLMCQPENPIYNDNLLFELGLLLNLR